MDNDTNKAVFEIQAFCAWRGDWHAEYVDIDSYVTQFKTLAEAEQEITNLVAIQCRDREKLRIVEHGPVRRDHRGRIVFKLTIIH